MTAALQAADFPAFFEEVHGAEPFPWQARLAAQIAETGEWPAVLDLPTGAGKTAALDIAVFHLALEIDKPQRRFAPVRIAFVVDRRIIVDDAFVRAEKIARALAEPTTEVVSLVAERLARLSERPEEPLLARRLRGGVPREEDWARTPTQPTILCSTVDQVGSRLLFRGYGIRDTMRPVHAGLLGADCLFLLDEAHLSEPFRQTLVAVKRHRERWRDKTAPLSPFQSAFLTATPDKPTEAPFGLLQADREHPMLRLRLEARKPALLKSIKGKSAETDDLRVQTAAAEVGVALDHLKGQSSQPPAVGVVVNRVLRARAIFTDLKTRFGEQADVMLIIGPARSIDRDAATEELRPIKTGQTRNLKRPLIVVATQTIEAGADLDFDGLITEVAPLDALKQRFGRLNRAGRNIAPYATILAAREDERPGKESDPVYGEAAAKTWKVLQTLGGEGARVDFGLSRPETDPWIGDIAPDRLSSLLADKPDAPVMMPAYVDLWSQTSPRPLADPEVSLFLHGVDRSTPAVQIVWREDLDPGLMRAENGADPAFLLSLLPPKAAEAVQVTLMAARRWLREDVEQRAVGEAEFADAPQSSPPPSSPTAGRPAFRWAGADDSRTRLVQPRDLKPDDVIVVPASYGGCDRFGWSPRSTEPVQDVADKAAWPLRAKRFALRFRLRASDAEEGGAPDLSFQVVLKGLLQELTEPEQGRSADRLLRELRERLDDATPTVLKEMPRGTKAYFPYGLDQDGHPRGVVFFAPHGIAAAERDADQERGGVPSTEDDALGSGDGSGLTLADHSADVEERATLFASKAGLPPAMAADIVLAAWLHDVGKADPRFQAFLYGGAWMSVDDRRVLAKSVQPLPRNARDAARLPDAWRHEALSVRIAREHPRFQDAHDQELVLWLIGVHHGHGRPLYPDAAEDKVFELPDVMDGLRADAAPGPQSLAFDFQGFDWPQMFERLKARYGVWELARLEAIVRLADHRASENPTRRGTPGSEAA